MVPRWIIDPDLVVLITGVLELAGAAGLLFRFTRPLAVTGLVVLLIAIFPANIKAARDRLTIRGLPATPLAVRALIQVVFILLLIWCVVWRPSSVGRKSRRAEGTPLANVTSAPDLSRAVELPRPTAGPNPGALGSGSAHP